MNFQLSSCFWPPDKLLRKVSGFFVAVQLMRLFRVNRNYKKEAEELDRSEGNCGAGGEILSFTILILIRVALNEK